MLVAAEEETVGAVGAELSVPANVRLPCRPPVPPTMQECAASRNLSEPSETVCICALHCVWL